jgi:5-methylcytosine-specific restriction endonuclease McrA
MTNARDLTKQLTELLRREHSAMADFPGASSSKGAAHYRKVAAELLQRFPEVVEPLRDGRLCITSIVHLAKVLTPENRHEMLPRFFLCSRRESMAVAAALQPAEAAPRREVVTAVRTAPPVALPEAAKTPPSTTRADSAVQPAELRSPVPAAPNVTSESTPSRSNRRDSADPVTADLSRLHVTVSRRFLEKLERAKAALSHSRPGASAEKILEAGLDLVLEQQAKRRGVVEKPRQVSRPTKTDRIPAHVKRAVWTRDDGRCQWPLDSGGICGSTLRLELDHAVPRARGGPSTTENLRVLCRFHNDLAARQQLGDEWMDRFTRTRSHAASPPR